MAFFLGKRTGVGCHFLLQGIFQTQESNSCLLHLLHWQVGSLPLLLSYLESIHELETYFHFRSNNLVIPLTGLVESRPVIYTDLPQNQCNGAHIFILNHTKSKSRDPHLRQSASWSFLSITNNKASAECTHYASASSIIIGSRERKISKPFPFTTSGISDNLTVLIG